MKTEIINFAKGELVSTDDFIKIIANLEPQHKFAITKILFILKLISRLASIIFYAYMAQKLQSILPL